jgi:hypothetical protein
MEPWQQTQAENSDLAALVSEDATFTLRLSDEELVEWQAFAELSSETLEQTIRRLLRRAITERADYEQARREFRNAP